jgi:RES domain-containing protein
VKLREHPRSPEFLAFFTEQSSNAKPLSGEFYRVAGPRHTTAKDIISGIGAYIAGGRWNPPEVMNVVYLSRDSETALREANEHFRYFNLPVWQGMPRVVVAVRADIESVLDLTTTEAARILPESMKSLLAEDWRAIMDRGDESTTQAIGRIAYQAGIQAILVPSKPDPNGINLLAFPGLLTRKLQLEVLNADALDKLGRVS